jgi:putative ABC transport system permease protein
MKNVNLGMHIDQTLVVPIPNELRDMPSEGFETELSQHPTTEKITYTSSIPGKESGNVGGGFRLENASSENTLQVYSYYVNKNYFDFLSIGFLAGSGLVSDQLYNDKNTELVINDAARRAFGFDAPEDAIGKIIYHDQDIVGRIKGVVTDHHNQSLDNPIAPAFFQYTKGKGYYLVKADPASAKETINLAEKLFKKNYPNYPFQYYFLDEQFNKQYNDHIRFGTVFGLFTMLAIFISCLGLSGLSMYVIKIRTKEIALRKVLGASVTNLLLMLSKDYVRLTVIAFVVAAPISYFLIEKWLQNFFYRIEIAWWMFVIPGVLVLAIALITVSAQSLKTALSKPADSLRNE